jgi:hypothetical protein
MKQDIRIIMHVLEWVTATMELQKSTTLGYQWQDIESIRQDVAALVATAHDPDFEPERVAMVAAELLENAMGHGDKTQTSHVYFSLMQQDGCLHIRVRNTIKDPDDLKKINALLAWIASCESKRIAYQTLLLKVFDSEQAIGGIGLARIAYEGHCDLECNKQNDHELEMHAILRARTTIT